MPLVERENLPRVVTLSENHDRCVGKAYRLIGMPPDDATGAANVCLAHWLENVCATLDLTKQAYPRGLPNPGRQQVVELG